jgi:hypothetical protein
MQLQLHTYIYLSIDLFINLSMYRSIDLSIYRSTDWFVMVWDGLGRHHSKAGLSHVSSVQTILKLCTFQNTCTHLFGMAPPMAHPHFGGHVGRHMPIWECVLVLHGFVRMPGPRGVKFTRVMHDGWSMGRAGLAVLVLRRRG